jgi:hypothetical protein
MSRVCWFPRLPVVMVAAGLCLVSTAAWAQQGTTTAGAAAQPPSTQQPAAPPASPAPAPAPAAGEVSPVKVTPYGIIYFNLFDNSAGTNNSDVPLWSTAGVGSLSASGRQSRFGLRVTGLTAAKAKMTAVIEADFFGGFPAVGIGDNMGVLRLRLATVRLDWRKASLIVGQDWMVFAPANPVSLASAGIPLMAATGNPWSRLPQVRGEWHSGPVLLQGAVLAPSTGDFTAAFLYQPASGALSQVPFVQGRAAFSSSNWIGTKKPASLGVSGHYGRARVISTTADRTIDSRGVAVDWSVPIVTRVTLAGEAFTGRNLAAFQAGIFQGVNPDSASGVASALVDGGARAIGTRGGWTQLVAAVHPSVNVQATYGLDDPRDDTLASISRRDWRRRNQAVAIGFTHKLSPQFSWGLEDRRIVTAFAVSGRRTTNHVNLAATFTF